MKTPLELVSIYKDGLLNDTLPFWIKHSIDREFGGFITSLNRDGTIVDTDKCIWAHGRASWLFGELYNNVEQRPEWLELAKHGVDFLDQHGFDPIDGRMWFHVAKDGTPIRKRRYSYSESFAAIAYGELAKATGNSEYESKAVKCFRQFIKHNVDLAGTSPKFTGNRPTRGLGFPMITIVTAQQLRESIGFQEASEYVDKSIDDIRLFHLNDEHQCVLETTGLNGEFIDHFDGRTLNPGHALEGAWFILREGQIRNDDSLVETGLRMLDWSWQSGWDEEHGGILYFVDAKGLPVQEYWHDMKFWWPQNEAIIATLLAFQITGNEKYAKWHAKIHDWAYSHFPDSKYGEWYGYLHRDGRLSSPLKGNLWKGPFHFPRMQLECWKIAEAIHGKS